MSDDETSRKRYADSDEDDDDDDNGAAGDAAVTWRQAQAAMRLKKRQRSLAASRKNSSTQQRQKLMEERFYDPLGIKVEAAADSDDEEDDDDDGETLAKAVRMLPLKAMAAWKRIKGLKRLAAMSTGKPSTATAATAAAAASAPGAPAAGTGAATNNAPDIDISSQHFSGAFFLALVHENTSFELLKARANKNLVRNIMRMRNELRLLVKNNLIYFLHAKDSIDEIHVSKDTVFKSGLLGRLLDLYQNLDERNASLFGQLITRKSSADSIRSALGTMSRLRFVFLLPSMIEEHIRTGDYKKVTRDYGRARYFLRRSALDTTKSSLFRALFDRVESRVDALRKEMYAKLILTDIAILQDESAPQQLSAQPDATATELRFLVLPEILADAHTEHGVRLYGEQEDQLIHHLFYLDIGKDPATFYLQEMKSFTIKIIEACDPEVTVATLVRALDPDLRRKQQVAAAMLGTQSLESTPSVVATFVLVQRMSALFLRFMHDFWALAHKIIRAKEKLSLGANSSSSAAAAASSQPQHGVSSIASSRVFGRSRLSEEDIRSMLVSMVNVFTQKLESIMAKLDNGLAHQPLLLSCVEEVQLCYRRLLDSAHIPEDYLTEFYTYSRQLQNKFIFNCWKRTVKQISCIYAAEDFESVREGTYVTRVPQIFRQQIAQTIEMVGSFEIDQDDPIFDRIKEYFLESLRVFTDSLHELLVQTQRALLLVPEEITDVTSYRRSKQTQLLSILDNVNHTRDVILEELVSLFCGKFMLDNGDGVRDRNRRGNESDEEDDTRSDSSGTATLTRNLSFDNDGETRLIKKMSFMRLAQAKRAAMLPNTHNELREKMDELTQDEEFQQILDLYDTINNLAISQFVQVEQIVLNAVIEKGMLLQGYDWARAGQPSTVRSFILELLLELSLVHSLLLNASASRDAIVAVLTRLCDRSAELFVEYTWQVSSEISKFAALQLHTEVQLIQDVLGGNRDLSYVSERARELFDLLIQWLEHVADYNPDEYARQRSKVVMETLAKISVQIECFTERPAEKEEPEMSRSARSRAGSTAPTPATPSDGGKRKNSLDRSGKSDSSDKSKKKGDGINLTIDASPLMRKMKKDVGKIQSGIKKDVAKIEKTGKKFLSVVTAGKLGKDDDDDN